MHWDPIRLLYTPWSPLKIDKTPQKKMSSEPTIDIFPSSSSQVNIPKDAAKDGKIHHIPTMTFI